MVDTSKVRPEFAKWFAGVCEEQKQIDAARVLLRSVEVHNWVNGTDSRPDNLDRYALAIDLQNALEELPNLFGEDLNEKAKLLAAAATKAANALREAMR